MKFNTVRAWKDEAYRLSLSDEALTQLPESPVGECELSEEDLAAVHGGYGAGEGKGGGSGIFSAVVCHSLVVAGEC